MGATVPWLLLIGYLFRYGPSAVSLAKEIWPLIHHDAVPVAERSGLVKRLTACVQVRSARGDERPINRLRNELVVRTGGQK